jgi:hypothetical protein
VQLHVLDFFHSELPFALCLLAGAAQQARVGFEAIDVLRVRTKQFVLRIERFYELVRGCRYSFVDGAFQF